MKKLSLILMSAVVLMLMGPGCFKGEENTCEYWGERLVKSAQIEKALQKISELKCTGALPTLQQLYSEGQFQSRILQAAKQLGDKEGAAPILKMALRSADNAKLAASIVADWKLSSTRDELMKILTDDALVDNREAALDALLSFEDPKNIEDLLITLAGADANLQGFLVNAKAIEQLGNIKSEKAVPTIVRMVFLRTNKGNEVWLWARIALAKIGGKAVLDEILKTAKGENTAVKEFTRKTGVHDWEIKGPKLSQLLADTLDPAAGAALIDSIERDIVQPVGVSEQVFQRWKGGEIDRLKIAVSGIGAIAPPGASERLLKIVNDRTADAVSQRINSANALAMVGDPVGQNGLVQAWKLETEQAFKRPLLQIAAMAMDHNLLAIEEPNIKISEDSLTQVLRKFEADAAALKAQIDTGGEVEPQAAIRLKQSYMEMQANVMTVKQTLDKISAYLSTVRDCRDDGSCYVKKLSDENGDVKVKAAFMLARGVGDDKEVLQGLIDAFNKADAKTQLDAKNFALMGIVRRGDKETGRTLLEMSEALGDKEKFFKQALEVYGSTLSNRAK